MKLRIKFKKYGPVRFIGHLDVMRYFQKCIRRAGIDVAYSTGFSPHQKMSFAAPLGVGLTSNGEYMDIEVNSLPEARGELNACQVTARKLNEVGVRGLDVVDVRILPEGAGNAMASVAAASYTVCFRQGRFPLLEGNPVSEELIRGHIPEFLAHDEILVTKETKRGVREVNLRPGIYELAWENSGFYMLLDASSGGNIKPIQVVEALLADCGGALQENSLSVTRQDVFTQIETENGSRFLSLGEVGYQEAPVSSTDAAAAAGGVL